MLRWFGFRDEAENAAPDGSTGYGAEVMESGWIPPQLQSEAAETHPVEKIDSLSDIADFLARIYANQVC